MGTDAAFAHFVNEVRLIGRVSGEPEPLELPSGDQVVSWRVVVPREDAGVDTIDCSAWASTARRAALRPLAMQQIHAQSSNSTCCSSSISIRATCT